MNPVKKNTLEGITLDQLIQKNGLVTWKAEQQRVKRIEKNKDSLRALWDNIKNTNIWIIGVPEVEEKGRDRQYLKTFLTWGRKHTLRFRKHRLPHKVNPKRSKPRHSIIEVEKVKIKKVSSRQLVENSLVTFNRKPISPSVDFSTETL